MTSAPARRSSCTRRFPRPLAPGATRTPRVGVGSSTDSGTRSHPRSATPTAAPTSLGVVKVLEGRNGHTSPDMPWEPKLAFVAVAIRFADSIR
jgi:hypothetical protein